MKHLFLFFLLSCLSLGKGALLWGQSDSLFWAYKQQLEEVKGGGEAEQIAEKHLQLGEFYREARAFSEAIDQYNEAFKLIGTHYRDTLSIILSNSMGKVHFELDNFDLAKQYFKDAIEWSNELGYLRGQAVAKSLLGTCFEKTGDYLEALNYQKESLSLFEFLKDSIGISIANENIGSIYEDLTQYDLAYQFFSKAYEYTQHTDTPAEANILNNLGDIHRKKGNYEAAIDFTLQAHQVSTRIKDKHQLESANKDLAKTYALLGNYQEAYQFRIAAEEYGDLILKDQNTNQLNRLQTIYDTNKKEAQIQLLQEQNKLNLANQQLLLLALFAMAIILFLVYYFNGRKKKAQLQLQEYEQRTLQAELDKKALDEQNLQREIQLKTAALSKYSLHLSQKNKILLDLSKALKTIAKHKNINYNSKIKELAKEIDTNLAQENEWEEFMSFFQDIHPKFIKTLSSLSNDSLSPAELRLSVLLRLNLSSKEIASILRITPDSVRVARHRLRKKLPIGPKDDLVHFMIEL